jgi:GNAT superfamily N-acetyltransferase
MKLDKELAEVLQLRDIQPGDVRFVLDSWAKSFRASPWAGVIPNHLYYDVFHESVEQLLARGTKIQIACAKHDPSRILGWVATEKVRDGQAVHFIYVKDPFRRRGLASHLLEQTVGTQDREGRYFYTYRTRDSGYLFGTDWTFAPEIARRK